MNKIFIIGTFVNKKNILCFIEEINNKFNTPYSKIFVFSIDSNEKEYLVTFQTKNKEKCLSEIDKSTVMHIKNGCLFSINALNKLIEISCGKTDKNFQLDWNEYKDKLIILTNGKLSIDNLNKIEDKGLFFK